MELPKPKKIYTNRYKYEQRRSKAGLYQLYRCNFCQYQSHDLNQVQKHQKRCANEKILSSIKNEYVWQFQSHKMTQTDNIPSQDVPLKTMSP